MNEAMQAIIEKTVFLPIPRERAFALFTEQISQWWPEDRRHTKDPDGELFLLAGGRFFERARDGQEVELGRVLRFEPPGKLVLDFYIGTDPSHPTEVTVTFSAETDGTRVKVEHHATPASDELWKLRAAAFERTWGIVLAALASAT
jgi:uncharacterized protein YndB with AHSA1/START domain